MRESNDIGAASIGVRLRPRIPSTRLLRGLAVVLTCLTTLAACQNDAQTGALLGAGIGALAGQAIGGDTEGTSIGAAAGAGLGYIIGNESDKAREPRYRGRPDD